MSNGIAVERLPYADVFCDFFFCVNDSTCEL